MRLAIGVVFVVGTLAFGCSGTSTGTGTPGTSGTASTSGGSTNAPPADGAEPSGGVPAGNVTAELAGKWFNEGEVWDFKADGTASHLVTLNSKTCESEDLQSGVAVVSGANVTFHVTSGINKSCGATLPFEAHVEHYSFAVEDTDVGRVLTLEDLDCTTGCTMRYDDE